MPIQANGTEIQEFSVNGNPVTEITYNGSVVWQDAHFQISNISAPGTVEEGTSYTVTADVTNTGDGRDTQTIDFNRGGSTSVQLDAGQSTTVSFSNTISSTGTYSNTISSDDDSQSIDVTVESTTPDTVTYTTVGITNHDVSNVTGFIEVKMWGAGGSDGPDYDGSGGPGGEGGYIEAEIDVTNTDNLDIWVPESGLNTPDDNTDPIGYTNGEGSEGDYGKSGAEGAIIYDTTDSEDAAILVGGGGGGGSGIINGGSKSSDSSHGGNGAPNCGNAGYGLNDDGANPGDCKSNYPNTGGDAGDGENADNFQYAGGETGDAAIHETSSSPTANVLNTGAGGQGNGQVKIYTG